MSRLDFKTRDRAEKTVEGLYKDLERRIIASPPGLCPVDMASAFLKMCHAQTCGKCVPCRVGLGQLENLIQDVLNTNRGDNEISLDILRLIEKTAQAIYDSADCAIGYEAANMVLKGLNGFREDYEEHVLHRRCAASIMRQRQSVPCIEMCPAGVDVPGYMALARDGRCEDAVRLIRKDNPFPTVCAFICEHPCETRCRRNMVDSAVNIRGLKRFAVDNAKNVPVPKRMPDTGKRVAIIGGGPSGLTAAYYLSLMGHSVKIFEKREQLGGMLRYGIPSYRLPRERLQEDIDAILSTGVEVELNYDMSSEEDANIIRNEFDALYIGIGAHIHKEIGIPGEYSRGVISAVEMLRGIGDGTLPDFEGKDVVVIGGGNVAMDVARTAKRLGAANVNIVYRRRRDDMTALAEEIGGAVAEGCNLMQLMKPSGIEANHDGNVKRLWVKPQIIGTNDTAGRPSPVDADVPEVEIPCQIIISAIGQAIDTAHFEKLGIPVNRGTIKAQSSSGIDGFPGVFAGGDCVTGPSTVIAAVAAGKVAAANIDAYLGYHHEMEVDVEIPEPKLEDKPPCGRVDLKLRLSKDGGGNFEEIEQGMTCQEAEQEASRCLRCDKYGFAAFRGGRTGKW